MGPTATLLPDGRRLHLQHGPIDLIIGAEGARDVAFDAAIVRFDTILSALVDELPQLRAPLSDQAPIPTGPVAKRMYAAAQACNNGGYLTPMAAVAGAVADEVLAAMKASTTLRRAYVNNGGDIALHLTPDAVFSTAIADHTGRRLGDIRIGSDDRVGGIATSGRHGRSHSLGIADSVTVLARTAAAADVAATLVANAVDPPGHPGITRRAASTLDEQTDLGAQPVVVDCAALAQSDCDRALAAGLTCANRLVDVGLIHGAALFLQGHQSVTPAPLFAPLTKEPSYA